VRAIRAAIAELGEFYDDHQRPPHQPVVAATGEIDRLEAALRALTAEHGSQCQCPGCAVLREA
jgi:hypothetical protein